MIPGIPADKRAELLSKHADGHFISGPEGHEVFVNRPSRAAWKRFVKTQDDSSKRLDALEQLLKDCLVYPDKPGLDAILDSRPALGGLFGARLLELAGAGETELKKE